MKTDEELNTAGFTASAVARFKKTVTDYACELFEKATYLGKADKAKDTQLEITSEHVRDAALRLQSKTRPMSKGRILCEIGERLGILVAGIGFGHYDKSWGLIAGIVGFGIFVILFVIRAFELNQI